MHISWDILYSYQAFALTHQSYLYNENPCTDENFIMNQSSADLIQGLLTPIYDRVILLLVPMTFIPKPNNQVVYAYRTQQKHKPPVIVRHV